MFYLKSPRKSIAVNFDYRLDPKTSGKWVCFGNRGYIGSFFKVVREYVNRGEFYEAKLMRVRNGKYALLVYADEETKDRFLGILKGMSLNPRWIGNSATRRRKNIKRMLEGLALSF